MPFAALGLPAPILKGVRAAGYTDPTPIQRKAIPLVLEGRDVIGAAQTGTGKTAAFILPILTRLLEGSAKHLRALVLTPTRELAAQVETNARDYARFTPLRVGVVYGGVPLPPQERMLRPGIDLLVATPGRLLDLHGRLALRLDYVETLVLDEADRMVDMGFAPDLRRILRLLPTERQTLLFSATMPPELNKVAKEALRDPARVDLAPPSRPAAGITQAIYPVPKALKTELLDEILSRTDVNSMIVFTRTKHGADRLAKQLQRRNLSVAPIHGNRSQSQRERALADLKRGRIQILVATDIASRGIDVEGISHVVNYDVPHTPEDYVHRIGRTGRVEAVGDAFTLMSPEEQKDVLAIERFLGRSIPRVVLPDFDYKAKAPKDGMHRAEGGSAGGRAGRSAGGARGHGSGRGGNSARAPHGGGRGGRGGRESHGGSGHAGHGGGGRGHGSQGHAARGGGQGQGHGGQGGSGSHGGHGSGPSFGRRRKAVKGVDRRRGRL
ncbi:MAG TPA: DEAD/DEAH box helicase [Candidatus Eisenbacteria bacterium]|nr:DEAD/DEAH box helicase [Candidatus Eisenbacteria bacterium]